MPKLQKGFAPVIIVLVIIVIGAVVGGYLFSKGGNSPINVPGTSQTTSKVSEKDFAFIDDEKVRKHFAAQTNQGTYRQKGSNSVKKGSTTNEYQPKGDSINTRTIEYGDKGETSHLITIGQTSGEIIYVKDYSDNKWWKEVIKNASPSPTAEVENKNVTEEYQQKIDLKPVYKFLGMAACGKLNCFKYQETVKESGQAQEVGRIFWFDDQKYLLRKEEIEFSGFKITNEYEYDNINIIDPSPTKDVPPGKSAYDYLQASQPSQEEINKYQQQLNQPQSSPVNLPQDYQNNSSDY